MWKELWIIMLILAFILIAISIVLIFVWDIPNIVDELSGKKAKRQIKILREMNANTSTFDRLSTNEIFSGISSGSITIGELPNIENKEITDMVAISEKNTVSERVNSEEGISSVSKNIVDKDEEDVATSYLSDDDEEGATSFLSDEEATSFLDVSTEDEKSSLTIKIIEEQSSLKGV